MKKWLWLGALSLVWSCGSPRSTEVVIDPALAMLAPGDAQLLVGVRLQPLRESTLWNKYIAGRKLPPLERWIEETGMDPRSDLWEVLAAHNGKEAVVLARGRFSPGGLEPALERRGARRFSYKGHTFVGEEQAAVVFLNPTTAAAGSAPRLRALLDGRGQTRGPVFAALLEDAAAVPPNNQIWFASRFAGQPPFVKFDGGGNLENLLAYIGTLDRLSGELDLKSGLSGHIRAHLGSPADAKRLHDAVRGLIGIGRLNTPSHDVELLRAFDGMKVAYAGQQVTWDIAAAATTLDRVLEQFARTQTP